MVGGDSTAMTLRHQRGSFEGFETKSHTVSAGRAMTTDSSTRITEQEMGFVQRELCP